jgi:hypothetical protein
MRVTNERAQSAIKAHHITGNLTNIVKDYAADLLEARELIKEMREQLSAVVSTASTPTTKGELVYVNNYIEMRELLERTKDQKNELTLMAETV